MYLGITLTTQVVQLPQGMDGSVLLAGFVLLPFATLSFLASRAVPTSRRHLGDRATIPVGCSAIALGSLVFAATDGTHLWAAFVTMGLFGVGGGFTFSAMPTLIIGAVPAAETSSAMSLHQVTRYVGFSFGSAMCVTLLHVFAGDGATPGAGAFRSAFMVTAAVALGAAVLAYRLAGRVVRPPGGRPRPCPGSRCPVGDGAITAELARSAPAVVGITFVASTRDCGA
jgi:dipeptide/tripeptide permease